MRRRDDAKIVIDQVFKIFGPDPPAMLPPVRHGMGKAELLASHGHVLALRDISLSIAPGELFVLMGLSGSGKSTLLRLLNRLIEPTAGRILIDGEDLMGLDAAGLRHLRRRRIAMVFQKFGLLPHRTVLQNVAYGLRVAGVGQRGADARAGEAIDRVGLSGFDAHYPGQLSGGMQQRVGLARALAVDGEVLLMDEPFSSLDPVIRNEMQTQLLQLRQGIDKTIVFITHDLDEALRLGDRIAILKDGAMVQTGTARDIVTTPADEHIGRFVRDVNRARVLRIGSIAMPVPSMARSAAGALNCLRAMGSAEGILLTERGRPVAIVCAAFATKHRDRPDAWWRSTESLPTLVTVDAAQSIEEALPALAASDAPVLVTGAGGTPLGVVTDRAAIRALAGRLPGP